MPKVRHLVIGAPILNFSRFSLEDFIRTEQGKEMLVRVVIFIKAVRRVYFRPFPRLGTLISIFGQDIFTPNRNEIEAGAQKLFTQLADDVFFLKNISLQELITAGSTRHIWQAMPWFLMAHLGCDDGTYLIMFDNLRKNFQLDPFNPCFNNSDPCCAMFDNIGIGDHFETFLDIMKHSVMLNEKANEDPVFISKYVNSTKIWKNHNLTFAVAEQTNLGIFLYCDIISNLHESKNTGMGCSNFVPVSTGSVLCYSFNSLPSNQIYKVKMSSTFWQAPFFAKIFFY